MNAFEVEQELLPGCLLLNCRRIADARGSFVKTFHAEHFQQLGISFTLREAFHSHSTRGVLRGMHFQLPPHDHDKLVACRSGRVLDVVLDLRAGPGYGRVAAVKLSGEADQLLFVPRGLAHGFLVLSDEAVMDYQTSSVHAPAHDAGLRWDSFGFDWGVHAPLLSPRDAAHPALADFATPFTATGA